MKYFSIEELSKSKAAQYLKIQNIPGEREAKNLEKLVDNVLDPLREEFRGAIIVNSGYRCTELNNALRGAKNSHHLKGCAADITAGSKAMNKILFRIIEKHLPFTQLIDEKDYQWVHVSYDENDLRKQILHL